MLVSIRSKVFKIRLQITNMNKKTKGIEVRYEKVCFLRCVLKQKLETCPKSLGTSFGTKVQKFES